MKPNCSPLVSLPPNPWSCDYFLGFVILGGMEPREMRSKEEKCQSLNSRLASLITKHFGLGHLFDSESLRLEACFHLWTSCHMYYTWVRVKICDQDSFLLPCTNLSLNSSKNVRSLQDPGQARMALPPSLLIPLPWVPTRDSLSGWNTGASHSLHSSISVILRHLRKGSLPLFPSSSPLPSIFFVIYFLWLSPSLGRVPLSTSIISQNSHWKQTLPFQPSSVEAVFLHHPTITGAWQGRWVFFCWLPPTDISNPLLLQSHLKNVYSFAPPPAMCTRSHNHHLPLVPSSIASKFSLLYMKYILLMYFLSIPIPRRSYCYVCVKNSCVLVRLGLAVHKIPREVA